MRVALISLEPWDAVWRRNQHLCAETAQIGTFSEILFVEPPQRRPANAIPGDVPAGVRLLRPRLRFPKSAGGLRDAANWLRRDHLEGCDLIWVNDPAFGVHCLVGARPAVYDVTDDWRSYPFPPRIIRRIVKAEDRLATRATAVVCSKVLQDRWRARYGPTPRIVPNGIDAEAFADARPRDLPGPGPHVGYVGTVQAERLDIDLLVDLATSREVGTLHLVGPDALDEASRARLTALPKIRLHGPVPSVDVPSWTKAMDVVICPHRVNDFTLSLDAIKAREYLASGARIVATPTSGFQEMESDASAGVAVVPVQEFRGRVEQACRQDGLAASRDVASMSWAARAADFSVVCSTVAARTNQSSEASRHA